MKYILYDFNSLPIFKSTFRYKDSDIINLFAKGRISLKLFCADTRMGQYLRHNFHLSL